MEEVLYMKLKGFKQDEIDVLFGPFPSKREVNPRSWDKKLHFWTEVLLEIIKHGFLKNSAFLVDKEVIFPSYPKKVFNFKGRGITAFEESFFKQVFFNGTLVNFQTNFTLKFLSQIFGYQLPLLDKVLVKPLIDECCDLILEILKDQKLLSFDDLIKKVNESREKQGYISLNHEDSHLLLSYLLKSKKVCIDTKYDNIFISKEGISNIDIDIYKLNQCINTLQNFLNLLEKSSFDHPLTISNGKNYRSIKKLEISNQIKNIETIRNTMMHSRINKQILENSQMIKDIIAKTESVTVNQSTTFEKEPRKLFIAGESKRDLNLISQIDELQIMKSPIKNEFLEKRAPLKLSDQ